jgi:hypothetical protein
VDGWSPSGLASGVCIPNCENCCELQKERLGEEDSDLIDSAGSLVASLALVFVFLLSVLH